MTTAVSSVARITYVALAFVLVLATLRYQSPGVRPTGNENAVSSITSGVSPTFVLAYVCWLNVGTGSASRTSNCTSPVMSNTSNLAESAFELTWNE
jgi:hypothetical protein